MGRYYSYTGKFVGNLDGRLFSLWVGNLDGYWSVWWLVKVVGWFVLGSVVLIDRSICGFVWSVL